jgi:hypothetical protein
LVFLFDIYKTSKKKNPPPPVSKCPSREREGMGVGT